MPTPTKPTKILELSGAFKKNPNRARGSEPKPEREIGRAPDRAGKTWTVPDAWDELVRDIPAGVLTCMDRAAFELLCIGMVEIWNEDANGIDRDRVFKQLGKFGMTSSERSKVIASKQQKPESDPFPDL